MVKMVALKLFFVKAVHPRNLLNIMNVHKHTHTYTHIGIKRKTKTKILLRIRTFPM